jgi:hypothetical protein
MPNATTNEKEVKALQAQVSELAAQVSETNSLVRSLLAGQGVQTGLIKQIKTTPVQLPQTQAKSANSELPPPLEAANLQCDPEKLWFTETEDGTIANFRGKPERARWFSCYVNHNVQDNTEAVNLLQQVKENKINPTHLVVSATPAWRWSKKFSEWEQVYYVTHLSVIASEEATEPEDQLELETAAA